MGEHGLSNYRQRLRDRLRESEARYRRIAERYSLATSAAKVGVWDFDVETLELYLDPNIKLLLGYRDAELGNQLDKLISLIHPDDRPVAMRAASAALDSKRDEYSLEFRMLHKTEGVRWISVTRTSVSCTRRSSLDRAASSATSTPVPLTRRSSAAVRIWRRGRKIIVPAP